MKPLLDVLKGARKIEIWLIIAMLGILLVLGMGELQGDATIASEEELRLQNILERISGEGSVSVMLSRDDAGLQGCVVAARDAQDIRTRLEMQRAVQALTGLELERIEIVQSKR